MKTNLQPALSTPWKLEANVYQITAPDGTSRLLAMDGSFHALSASATEMLQASLERGGVQAAETIARRYEVPLEEVRVDLAAFLGELDRLHLIQPVAAAGRRVRTYSAMAILLPLLMVVRLLPLRRIRIFSMLTMAWASFACFGWSATLAAWKIVFPEKVAPREGSDDVLFSLDRQVRGAAAGHFLRVECKERALTMWALARMAGQPSRLVVGVQFFPLAGHCWCESGTYTLSDDRESCDLYQPVLTFA